MCLLTGAAAELPAHLDFVNKNRSYYDSPDCAAERSAQSLPKMDPEADLGEG